MCEGYGTWCGFSFSFFSLLSLPFWSDKNLFEFDVEYCSSQFYFYFFPFKNCYLKINSLLKGSCNRIVRAIYKQLVEGNIYNKMDRQL